METARAGRRVPVRAAWVAGCAGSGCLRSPPPPRRMVNAMTAQQQAISCFRCGRSQRHDPPVERLAWVAEREEGRASWLCPACARRHVRDIEGKLPSEYW